jgi:hypothetical protein
MGAHRLHRPVAQVELPAGEEAAGMAVLEGQQVLRMFLRDPSEIDVPSWKRPSAHATAPAKWLRSRSSIFDFAAASRLRLTSPA